MRRRSYDPLLIRTLDLNTAALSVAEATAQLIEFLRSGPTCPGRQHDYETSCRYFTRAHQQYMTNVAAFIAELTETKTAAAEHRLEAAGDRVDLAEARAVSRRIRKTLQGRRSA